MANPVPYPFTSWQGDASGADTNNPVAASAFMNVGATNDLSGWLRTLESTLRLIDTNLSWERWLGLNAPQSPSPNPPVFVDGTHFSLTGDWTSASAGNYPAICVVNRRVKCSVGAGTIYGYISAASFSGGITTVTIAPDAGVLDGGLTEVQFGIPYPGTTGNTSIPQNIITAITTNPLVQGLPTIYTGTTSGTNTYTTTLSPVPPDLAHLANGPIVVNFVTGNTAAATLNPNGLGAINLQKNGAALVSGDLPTGTIAVLYYDGTNFQVLNIDATNLQGVHVSSAPPSQNEVLLFDGTRWIPAFPQLASLSTIGSITLTNPSVNGNAGTTIFSFTVSAPSTPSLTNWVASVSFVVNFVAHSAAASNLTCVLTDNASLFTAGIAGSTNINSSATHTASVVGNFQSNGHANAGQSVTFTLTGYNAGVQADLQTFPDTSASLGRSFIQITWIPSI